MVCKPVVDGLIVFHHAFVGEIFLGLLHDAFDLGIFVVGRELVELHGLIDGPAESVGVEVLEEEAVAVVLVNVEVPDGVLEAAGGVGDGKGTVSGPDHLRQPAGLEGRGHEDEVGPSVAQVRE